MKVEVKNNYFKKGQTKFVENIIKFKTSMNELKPDWGQQTDKWTGRLVKEIIPNAAHKLTEIIKELFRDMDNRVRSSDDV